MFKRILSICMICSICSLSGVVDLCAEDTIEGYIASAKSYQSKGDYAGALKELQKIENISSLSDSAKKMLLDEYISLSGNAINHASLRTALAVTDSAINAFPEDRRLLIKRGKAKIAVGNYKEAVNIVGQLVVNEGGESKDPELIALGYVTQGYGLESAEPGKITNASELQIKNYRGAISADPVWFLPYMLLGVAYISEKDYSKSQEYYEKGIALNPKGLSHKDYILLASVYNETKLHQKVKDLLKDVPTKHPYWPGVHLYLGYAEENAGNLLNAFYHYNYEMFISGPKGFFFQGAQQALAHIIQEIGSDKSMRDKYLELADCIEGGKAGAEKDFKRSIAYYSKVEKGKTSANPILYLLLGEAYMQNKDYDKTISYLQKVVSMDPSFPPAYCEIGDMYAEKGDMDNAILWWERSFATDPENWKVQYTKERLRKANFSGQKFSDFLKRNNLM